jgi:hypothetical protein
MENGHLLENQSGRRASLPWASCDLLRHPRFQGSGGVAAAKFRIPPVLLGYLDHSRVNCCFHETIIRAKQKSDQKGF